MQAGVTLIHIRWAWRATLPRPPPLVVVTGSAGVGRLRAHSLFVFLNLITMKLKSIWHIVKEVESVEDVMVVVALVINLVAVVVALSLIVADAVA